MPMIFSALAERIRGASSSTDALHALRGFVEHSRGLRIVLYANEQRLSDVLGQRRNNVSEVLSSEDISAEIGAGYLSFVSGRVSGKASISEKIELTPLMKAILLEETEKDLGFLVDLSVDPPCPGHLLRHVGASRLFGPWDERLTDADMERAFGADAIGVLEKARDDQARKLTWGKSSDLGTIVWAARESLPLAAIGSFECADGGSFASYSRTPPFGLIGMLEAELGSCVLLSPLAIWHESVAAPA